ncbi:MAG: hydrogenase maturation nickel metallochaperone HypA [Thermoleophilia bacterium]
MHELGITQGILDRAAMVAREHGAERVSDIYVTMTSAADFTEEALAMYFEMLVDESALLRGARLHVAHTLVDGRCLSCGAVFPLSERYGACPACGSPTVIPDQEAPMVQLTDIAIDDEGEQGRDGGA